jgi:hypothetical protein
MVDTLCYALFDQRDLVQAIADQLTQLYTASLQRMLTFSRVKIIWGSDDMGFKTGPLISPADLRAFVLPGHTRLTAMAHAAGKPYLLHACGNLACIMNETWISCAGPASRRSASACAPRGTPASRAAAIASAPATAWPTTFRSRITWPCSMKAENTPLANRLALTV